MTQPLFEDIAMRRADVLATALEQSVYFSIKYLQSLMRGVQSSLLYVILHFQWIQLQ